MGSTPHATPEQVHHSQETKFIAGINKIHELVKYNIVDNITQLGADSAEEHLRQIHENHRLAGTLTEINIGDVAYDLVSLIRDGNSSFNY